MWENSFSDLIRFAKSTKKVDFPFLINCRHLRIKKLSFKPDRIYFDTEIVLDFIVLRWCKEDGYPLWYSSFSMFSRVSSGEYIGCFSNFSLDQIRGIISNHFEHRNNRLGKKKIKKAIELRKVFKFVNLTEEEKDNALDYSDKYNISVEDAIHVLASEKIGANTFLTRDGVLLDHKELNTDKFQIVQPETIVGRPSRIMHLSRKYQSICPENIVEYLEEKFKELKGEV